MRWSVIGALGAMACAAPGGGDEVETPVEVPWRVDDCGEAPIGDGYELGDVLPDFALVNQRGSTTRLADFCDQVVLLEVAGFW